MIIELMNPDNPQERLCSLQDKKTGKCCLDNTNCEYSYIENATCCKGETIEDMIKIGSSELFQKNYVLNYNGIAKIVIEALINEAGEKQ